MRDVGTMHGVDRSTPMSWCYSKVRRAFLHEGLIGDGSAQSKADINNACVDLEVETIGAPSADLLDMCSQISIRSVSNLLTCHNLTSHNPKLRHVQQQIICTHH